MKPTLITIFGAALLAVMFSLVAYSELTEEPTWDDARVVVLALSFWIGTAVQIKKLRATKLDNDLNDPDSKSRA